MADFVDNASTTETSSPDVSTGSTGETTSASGTGGDDFGESGFSLDELNVGSSDTPSEGSEESDFDLGWKLEDPEQPIVADAIPDDDSDIDKMLEEPGVDKEKAPGVVMALKNARKGQREATQELKQIKTQVATLEQYGGVENVAKLVGSLAPLMRGQEGSANQLIGVLWEQAKPAYKQLLDTFIDTESKYLVKALGQKGLIPEASSASQSPTLLSAETLATIPENLQAVARKLALEQPAILEDMLAQRDDIRNYNLERERQMLELSEGQQTQLREQWNSQVAQAEEQGRASFTDISSRSEQAIYKELGKWTPFGKDNAAANQDLHQDVVEGAFRFVLKDEKYAKMYTDMEEMFAQAPIDRLHGEAYKADEQEREARKLGAQLSSRIGQVIKAKVQRMNSVFADAQKWREQERKKVPTRNEIPGRTTTTAQSRNGSALNSEGKLSQDYLDSVAQSLGV